MRAAAAASFQQVPAGEDQLILFHYIIHVFNQLAGFCLRKGEFESFSLVELPELDFDRFSGLACQAIEAKA